MITSDWQATDLILNPNSSWSLMANAKYAELLMITVNFKYQNKSRPTSGCLIYLLCALLWRSI